MVGDSPAVTGLRQYSVHVAHGGRTQDVLRHLIPLPKGPTGPHVANSLIHALADRRACATGGHDYSLLLEPCGVRPCEKLKCLGASRTQFFDVVGEWLCERPWHTRSYIDALYHLH